MVYSTETHNQANFVGISLIKISLNRIEIRKMEQNFITLSIKVWLSSGLFPWHTCWTSLRGDILHLFHPDTAKNMVSRSRNSHMPVRNKWLSMSRSSWNWSLHGNFCEVHLTEFTDIRERVLIPDARSWTNGSALHTRRSFIVTVKKRLKWQESSES